MNSPFQALRLITRLSSALASVSNRHTTQRFYSSSMAASSEFHALSTQTIKGEPYDFAQLKGHPVLIVNVASHCGFTGQYKGLQSLYDRFKDRGLVILGFPCNQFGNQEPGGAEEIVEFCSRTYSVTFPIMAKCDVNGPNTSPVYQFLKSQKKQMMMEMIKWNFEKFLVDKEGNVVGRYSSMASPESIANDIEKLL